MKKNRSNTLIASIVICLNLLFAVSNTGAQNSEGLKKQILLLIDNGAVMLGDEKGSMILSYNPQKLYVPASIIKILTAYIALDMLGKDYRFTTEFYRDSNNNLVIKGVGDPYLISEEIDFISHRFKEKGITVLRQLFLDHSAFEPVITIPGVSKSTNPYDALNGALVVNFNTINVKKGSNGVIVSGEKQTPLTPIAKKKGKSVRTGAKERINLSANKEDCLQYVGELFAAIFSENGISIENSKVGQTEVESTWNLLYTHKNSRQLPEVLKGLLKYSNNFIANQIFLTVGAREKGYPATLVNAKSVFEDYIRTKLNIEESELVIDEGSGISRNNKATARVMMWILEQFREYTDLLPLKNNIFVKSGTLTGVYNYAGYIKTSQGLRPFVIILNQRNNTRDSIMKLLTQF